MEEPPTHRGMTGELQPCEPMCMITEWVHMGTSELGEGEGVCGHGDVY